MPRPIPEPSMTDIEAERLARRRKIGQEIRTLRGEMSQEDLGLKLANWNEFMPGVSVPQANISRWELGKVNFSLETLLSIEDALGAKRGIILQRAGVVKQEAMQPGTVNDMIRVDPDIHPMLRENLVSIYSEMVKASKKLFIQENFVGRRN